METDSDTDSSGNNSYISKPLINPPSAPPPPQDYSKADPYGDTSILRPHDTEHIPTEIEKLTEILKNLR